ncbi:tetratricopeptide repeat protein [Chryseobacterium sp.]|uniref:tetratricopeptide repeat protein n=1 Tax=Chryseobacterium sp. TaxID=1871047 RepID=UPI002FCA9769
MNKLLFILGFFVTNFWVSAQTFSDEALQQSVHQLNNAKTDSDYDTLFHTFSETKTSEKWKANYYAAVAMYSKAQFLLTNTTNTPMTEPNELARKFAAQALASEKNNGEINTLLGLIHIQKIRIVASTDPQKDLKTAIGYMTKADTQLKNNPRLTHLKAEIAELSNNKTEAIKLHQTAASEFKDLSAGSPNWGKQLIEQ